MRNIKMILKDMKDAKIHTIELDKERPLTIDFNSLGLIQEFGYYNPFEILNGVKLGLLNSIKIGLYAGLVSGLQAEDEKAELDISITQLGRMLGVLMVRDNEAYKKILGTLVDAMTDFLPEEDKKEDKEGKEKN